MRGKQHTANQPYRRLMNCGLYELSASKTFRGIQMLSWLAALADVALLSQQR
jgi:hypothetical protein